MKQQYDWARLCAMAVVCLSTTAAQAQQSESVVDCIEGMEGRYCRIPAVAPGSYVSADALSLRRRLDTASRSPRRRPRSVERLQASKPPSVRLSLIQSRL